MSKRTDGGPADKQPIRSLPDPAYGEGKEFREIQQGAPMMAQNVPASMDPAMRSPEFTPPPALMDSTQRPDEPITAGVPIGDGPSSMPSYDAEAEQDWKNLKAYLPDLEVAMTFRNTPQSFRTLVNYIRASQ